MCFPHSYLLSSFPSHLSHLSCNRLSPFVVAPAFMGNVPQGVRVIVCLFLKAGGKPKHHSWKQRTSDVGVLKQQRTIFCHRHRSDMFFLANRNQACCFGEHDEVFGPHHFISQVSCMYVIFFIYFFIFFYLLLCVLGGAKEYLMPPFGKHILLKLQLPKTGLSFL